MNAPERIALPDIQSVEDRRGIAIDAVGIQDLRHPLTVRAGHGAVATVGTWSMSVALPAAVKGTHMSRFLALLDDRTAPLDLAGLRGLAVEMLRRLQASQGTVEVAFAYFLRKAAPVSGIASLVDYDVRWRVLAHGDGRCLTSATVVVPVTSLCPCSKEISDYGAHNQRSHVQIEAELAGDIAPDELITIAERAASCEIYGLLKRVDEKHVTERAYDNPRFVEDLVREVALALDDEPRVRGFAVTAENFESIHNHSAIARIVRRAPDQKNRPCGRCGLPCD